MARRRRVEICLGLVLTMAVLSLGATEPTRLMPETTPASANGPAQVCSPGECEITLALEISLLDRNPPILPVSAFFATQHASGRFITTTDTRNQIVVFDSIGVMSSNPTERETGSSEFTLITNIFPGPDGALFVYDRRNHSFTLLGPDLSLGPTTRAPFRPAFIRENGETIAAEQILTPALIGYPIHLVDAAGQVIRSFGTDTPGYRNDLRRFTDRIVAPGRNGTVWAAPPGRYVLERWDPESGDRLARIVVRSPWFEEFTSPISEAQRPYPILRALWEQDDFLWVLLRDADTDWKPPVPGARPFNLDEYNQTFDWVLDVIDPESGRVIATKRFDTVLWGRPSSPFLISRIPAKDGNRVRFDVWRPQLKPKEKVR